MYLTMNPILAKILPYPYKFWDYRSVLPSFLAPSSLESLFHSPAFKRCYKEMLLQSNSEYTKYSYYIQGSSTTVEWGLIHKVRPQTVQCLRVRSHYPFPRLWDQAAPTHEQTHSTILEDCLFMTHQRWGYLGFMSSSLNICGHFVYLF